MIKTALYFKVGKGENHVKFTNTLSYKKLKDNAISQ